MSRAFETASTTYFPDVDRAIFMFCLLQHRDRKSTRLNSSHGYISYAVFCLKKKTKPSFQSRPMSAGSAIEQAARAAAANRGGYGGARRDLGSTEGRHTAPPIGALPVLIES